METAEAADEAKKKKTTIPTPGEKKKSSSLPPISKKPIVWSPRIVIVNNHGSNSENSNAAASHCQVTILLGTLAGSLEHNGHSIDQLDHGMASLVIATKVPVETTTIPWDYNGATTTRRGACFAMWLWTSAV